MISVVVADDQTLVRAGFRVLIESADDLEVVGEAEDGRAVVDLVTQTSPDVVLMDVRMPVMDGIEATRRIKDRWPRMFVLGLTAFTDYPEIMLGAGADKCLLKTESYGSLTHVMERIRDESETGTPWF